MKKVLTVNLVLFGIFFFQITGECFGLPADYAREGLSNSERVYLLYAYVTGMWPADEIWPQMREAMTNIADGDEAGAQAAIDKLRTEFSGNQYLPVALHEIAKLYRLVGEPVGERDKSLQLHQYIVDNWPSHEYTMWSLRELAILENARGNVKAAQAITEKVLTDFADNEYIAFVGYEIAIRYQLFKNYEEAKQLYQYVIDTWPEQTDYARWCQAGLDEVNLALANQAASVSEIKAQVKLAKSSIVNDDMKAAEAAINKLRISYPQDPHIAEPLFEIAECYRQFEKYEKAGQLYQYVADTWPQHVPARWSQLWVAVCHINLGNMQAAESAIDKLLANHPYSELMAGCFYEIANAYNRSGNYEKAKQFYQSVLETWPEYKHTVWAQIGQAQSNIGLGDNVAGEAIIDTLVTKLAANYPDKSDLPPAAAEVYYYVGSCCSKMGQYEDSTAYYQKVINGCPDSKYACRAQFGIGSNYQNLKKVGIISESEADQKTKAAYEQVLEKYPSCVVAAHAQAWLNRHNSKQKG